jgi:PGF-pre-PGF domain-containing protein
MKDLKVFLLLISLSLELILSSRITFAQLTQPSSGKFALIDVFYNVGTVKYNSTGPGTNVTNASIEPTPSLVLKNFGGTQNQTINSTENFVVQFTVTGINNITSVNFTAKGAENVTYANITINGTTAPIPTITQCLDTSVNCFNATSDSGNVLIYFFNLNSSSIAFEVNITYNYTITLNSTVLPSVVQLNQSVILNNESKVNVFYNQTGLNVSAPFLHENITLSATLPDDSNVIVSGTYIDGIEVGMFRTYNVTNVGPSGNQSFIIFYAPYIVYSTVNPTEYRKQVFPAYVDQNVTWKSNYTIYYNNSFTQLNVSGLRFNHTFWPDAYMNSYLTDFEVFQNDSQVDSGNISITSSTNSTLINITTDGKVGIAPREVYVIHVREKTPPASQTSPVIGAFRNVWFKVINITNPSQENYYLWLNLSFKSISDPQLWNGTHLIANSTWNDTSIPKFVANFSDTDNDNYYEYLQWNITIPASSQFNFTINGTRWASITASLSKDWIYTDESTTISGDSKYMDNDAFPDYSPSNITILIYEHYPFQLIKSYVAEVNTTTKSFSQAISGLLSGVYDVWVERTDEDNIFAKSPILTLYVYLRPSFSSISIPTPPPAKAEISIPSLPPGIMKTFDIEQANTPFTQVSISVKNRVVNVKISVEKLVEKPAVPEPRALVYHFISVTPANIKDEDITEAKIKFKVEKSWINQNNISVNTIALLRFSNNTWNKLPTTKVSEDANYIYFEAETPGFSYFAISGEKIVLAPPAPVCGNGICEAGEDYTNCPADCPAPKPKCTCTDWKNVECGVAPCKQSEMKQTRTCTPSGCDLEERCIADPKCIPKPPAFPIWAIAIAMVVIILILFFVFRGIVHR